MSKMNTLKSKINQANKSKPLRTLFSILLICGILVGIYFLIDHFYPNVILKFKNLIIGAENKIEQRFQSNKQVFHIKDQIFKYEDAEPLCKAYGAELATVDQLIGAYDKGANWCSRGWSKNQMGLYPIQKDFWLKLQNNPNTEDVCGEPGVNGGYYNNTNMKFGVNCYGVKPNASSLWKDIQKLKEIQGGNGDALVAKYLDQLDKYNVESWDSSKWSEFDN